MAQQQQQQYPVSVYQRQLMNVQPVNTGGGSWQNVGQSGLKLAKTLGVLSDMSYQKIINDRQQKIDENKKAAATAISKATLEELKTRDVTDLLTKYGVISLADNPWAIAEADKIKAASLAAEARAGYDVYKLEHQIAPAKNADEEAKQFSDYMQEKFSEYTKDTGYTKAFQDSFFENFTNDQIQVAQSRHAEISKEIEVRIAGGLQKMINVALNHYYNQGSSMNPKEAAKNLGNIVNNPRFQALGLAAKLPILQNIASEVAHNIGSPELLNELANTVVDVDPMTGEKVTWSQLVDFQSLYPSARGVAGQKQVWRREELFEQMKPLRGKALYDFVEKLRGTDRELGDSLIQEVQQWQEQQDREAEARAREEAKEREQFEKDQFELNQDEIYKQEANRILTGQMNGWMNGKSKDEYGNLIATSAEALPKVDMAKYGSLKTTQKSIDAEIINSFCMNYAENIMNNPNYTPDAKMRKMLKLIMWAPAGSMKGAYANIIRGTFLELNTNNIKNGNLPISNNLKQAVQMYKYDSGAFRHCFGDDMANAVYTLLNCQGASLGQKAVNYARIKDITPDKDKQYRDEFKRSPIRFEGLRIKGADGSMRKINSAIIDANPDIFNDYNTKVLNLRKTGLPLEQAKQKAREDVVNECLLWRNTLLPKAIFGTGGSPEKTLNSLLSKYKKDFNLWDAPIHISWSSHGLTFSCNMAKTWVVSPEAISNQHKYISKKASQKEAAQQKEKVKQKKGWWIF